MTGLSGHWLRHPGTQKVLGLLGDAGHGAYLVGGCVRNDLMGLAVGDIDIATDARPDRVGDVAESAGLRVVPTGIDHGTVTIIADGLPHEVTTFRADVETDGRHAVVRFSGDMAEDARRRDFTMNALYADASGSVFDPLGGLADLRARRVRFIDDASARIAEDHLRILRFFRFHAWYGDPAAGLDAEGLAACAAGVDGLAQLSRERITAELLKLLSALDPAPAIAAMAQAGILNAVLPGADPRLLPVLVHLECLPPDPLRRLAALGGDTARLRLSRKEAEMLVLLRDGMGGTGRPAALAYRHGATPALNIALLRAAQFEVPLPEGIEHEIETGAAARFPVSARDLMPELTGAALGRRLKELETRWIGSGFTLTREDLLA
ncbi:CCA tRNA nucleotidyltransferase [Oceaniglobus trochenteri]|uniref:CCA tRNA nucleotidyltransferase n=1 Tax=Oceaniglobus trochenteri TaxID=2763260 RepID=UPI001CFF8BEA|nr:CCA tRNA nucleotidyltransferase [Oceaniglobus trochenteri]